MTVVDVLTYLGIGVVVAVAMLFHHHFVDVHLDRFTGVKSRRPSNLLLFLVVVAWPAMFVLYLLAVASVFVVAAASWIFEDF